MQTPDFSVPQQAVLDAIAQGATKTAAAQATCRDSFADRQHDTTRQLTAGSVGNVGSVDNAGPVGTVGIHAVQLQPSRHVPIGFSEEVPSDNPPTLSEASDLSDLSRTVATVGCSGTAEPSEVSETSDLPGQPEPRVVSEVSETLNLSGMPDPWCARLPCRPFPQGIVAPQQPSPPLKMPSLSRAYCRYHG